MDIRSQLQELGFSANDSKVYVALLDLKQSGISSLISKTGLHKNIVYTSLNHLVARKLVMEKMVGGKKVFMVTSPEILKEEFARKMELAQQAAAFIAERQGKVRQEITIHQGNEEYLDLLASTIKAMPKGSVKYVMGTGGAAFMRNTMSPIWKNYHKVAHQQDIRINMLSYESQRGSVGPQEAKEGIYDIRFLPDESENPAGIHIYPSIGVVLNIIYSDDNNPVTAIRIQDEKLTQGYLNLFNSLWATAKS